MMSDWQRIAKNVVLPGLMHIANISHDTTPSTEYYRRHRMKRIEQVREYQRSNPEVKRAAYNTRRARKRSAAGRHTAQDLRHIYESQAGHCFYCDLGPIPRRDGHFDHLTLRTR